MTILECRTQKDIWGEDNAYLFQQENINDVIFRGYENPEREEMLKLFDIVLESAREQLK